MVTRGVPIPSPARGWTVPAQLTLVGGRSLEQKRGFYKQVADQLHERLGVRREDVVIGLVPVEREDWSFGDGEASLVR